MKNSVKILAVDDEEYMLKVLNVCLKPPRFELETCSNAMSAMSAFKKKQFDILLLDIVMPGIDGFELHSIIRNTNPDIPIIMLTAKVDDMNSALLKKISADKNTYYQSKSFQKDELTEKISEIIKRKNAESERIRYLKEIEKDVALAGEVQHCMIPTWNSSFDDVRLSVYYLPFMKITGDILNFHKISEGVFLSIIGDISGHGVQSALIMSAVNFHLFKLISSARPAELAPHKILNSLHSFIIELATDRYMTCIAMLVDFNSNTLAYQSAGHPDATIYSPALGKFIRPNPEGKGSCPPGLVRETTYSERDTVLIPLPDDAVIFMYTDGLTDLQDKIGSTYNINPLEEFCGAFAKNGLEASTVFKITDALYKLGFDEKSDDITLAAVSRIRPRPNCFESILKPMLSEVDEFAQRTCDLVTEKTGDGALAAKVELLIAEFLNNVVVHGLGNKNAGRPVISAHVEFREKDIVLSFCDKGKVWDMNTQESFHESASDIQNYKRASSGRGMGIMKNIASSITRNRYADRLNETIFVVPYK